MKRREDRKSRSGVHALFNPSDSMTLSKKRRQRRVGKSPILLVEGLFEVAFSTSKSYEEQETASSTHAIFKEKILNKEEKKNNKEDNSFMCVVI